MNDGFVLQIEIRATGPLIYFANLFTSTVRFTLAHMMIEWLRSTANFHEKVV
jgi:hypothetical protein